ncbi:di-trans,poly-cis-decaprenylcistransferase (plasmid) [Paracoccus liaowanqingii]|uniref:Di-trans,poly-cis-decaprenylcistransferase n=1 Tax=Paracoccus liaowanqingii TaxID=2560053 RepID=A0A4Y5SW03_9RHOB|nr:glycoside hydrolase family 88 protein [Paracoccus liaowanqingii]QDA36976.1 di-trans,poly-cis-decaprenylcistransferase [Paracoccus liaowanqingii]
MLDYFDAFATRYRPYKGGAWCYEDGCIYRGLQLLSEATGEARWRDHLLRLAQAQVAPDGTLSGYDPLEYNIDNILAGRVLFALDRWTGDPRWMRAARQLGTQLADHPRTAGGSYWHKKIYPCQIWLDGLYMGLPFQIELGRHLGDQRLVQDALAQLREAMALTARPDGLYAHGCDTSRAQDWADKATGQSASAWARALGWQAMALVDSAALTGLQTFAAAGLEAPTRDLLARIAVLQRDDGGWLQVIDQPDLAGNYTESSASAMFAYALNGAVGLAPAGAPEAAARALRFLEGRLRHDGQGAGFGGICLVAGLGGFSGVYRDGTPAYYLTEPVVADDAKGTGPLMMAAAQAMMAATERSTRVASVG